VARYAVDYLYTLSDAELLLYVGTFGVYPTADARQRGRVERLLSGEIQAERLTDAFKPRRRHRADLAALRKLWHRDAAPAPGRPPNERRPVVSDRGEWWGSVVEAAADLGVARKTVRRACGGKHGVKGRALAWSSQANRPPRARAAA
jgi:hypothetical protein